MTFDAAMKTKLAAAFDEWLRQYIEDPKKFLSDWESISRRLREIHAGHELSYGSHCVAMLEILMKKAA